MANDSELKRIGGLWISEKNGRKYLSGKLDEPITLPAGMRILIFPARDRKSDKSPTHTLLVAPPTAAARRDDSGDEDVSF
jgi:uncharacterized protein (DUF736 family)